ncbi:MAG: hypothetical protein NUK54_01755 [Methanothrix sp.]|nr:hypothetical protein [Methanothrix sp.]
MKNSKSTLLYLAVAITIFSTGQVAADWLAGNLGIADVHHTAEYLAKAGSGGQKDAANASDGGIATLPAAPAERQVYNIGGTSATAQPPAGDGSASLEPSDFSGRWSFALVEDAVRSFDLALYQRGEIVFGKGVLGPSGASTGSGSSEDRGIDSMIDWLNLPPSAGSSASQGAASGTVAGDEMKLDLVTLDSIALYRFDLSLVGDIATGIYTAYGSDGSTWSGNVTGSKID